MSECVDQLMTPQSTKFFFNNYTIKPVIKKGKIFIYKLQIVMGEIIYMQKLKCMYSYTKDVNAMIPLSLKRFYIQPGQLFYGKKQALMLFTCLSIKATNFWFLRILIYLVGLKLNLCAFFLLGLLRIFFRMMLFISIDVLEN